MSNAKRQTLAHEREQIGRATHFTAYLFNGRFDKHTSGPFASYAEALDGAAALNRDFATNVRRAIIYAITPEGWTIQVTSENLPDGVA